MKQKIAKKIVSVVLVLAMVMCTVPVTEIATFASDMSSKDTTGTTDDEKELTLAEAIEKEVAERNAIKKNRSKIKKIHRQLFTMMVSYIKKETFHQCGILPWIWRPMLT